MLWYLKIPNFPMHAVRVNFLSGCLRDLVELTSSRHWNLMRAFTCTVLILGESAVNDSGLLVSGDILEVGFINLTCTNLFHT